jgi:hypothetical protein
MAYQLDAKFFRKAKKVNRAVELTDTQAVIPAVKDSPEIRVPLPNRRLKTMEERGEALAARFDEISELEENIDVERRRLMELIKAYKESSHAGVSEIVVKNLEIQKLMDRRRTLRYPQTWIESIAGITLVDILASKRDLRMVGGELYQVKNRVEPIESLYIDLGAAGARATVRDEMTEEEFVFNVPTVPPSRKLNNTRTKEETAKGAIIASAKKAFKLKETTPMFSGGGGGP